VRSFDNLGGKKIAVIAGTTNESAIQAQLKRRLLSATVVPFKSRDEAFAALQEGKADAFASDRLLLVGSVARAKDQKDLVLLPDELSFEPYGIVLPRGDTTLRLAVNTGLAQLYSSGQVLEIFRRWFEAFGQIPPIIQAAYILGSFPE
jgi:ABC-type amino acid transport substrate-binding protein